MAGEHHILELIACSIANEVMASVSPAPDQPWERPEVMAGQRSK